MKKGEIRKEALSRRKLLSVEQVSLLSHKILEHFSSLDLSSVRTIHLFLPIVEKNEPDTFLIIDWLASNHPEIQLVVPRSDFETARMTNHYYEDRNQLKKNIYNILEPQSSKIYSGDIDLVLIPLLAFDLKGNRVGYGKGFYDRFLEGIETHKVGISLFEPVESIADTHENDIRLDVCITPDKIYRFD